MSASSSAASIKPSFRLDWRGIILPLLALGAWQIASQKSDALAYVFVPLEDVARSAWHAIEDGELAHAWIASIGRTLLGFVIGASIGVTLGGVMAISRFADAVINPLYQAIRQVPLIGYIPLISLWFGNGEGSKTLIIALAAFYPTVLNSYEGLRNIDARFVAVGRVLKADRWRMFRFVTLPNALPSIFTGLSLAVAFSWLSSIASEFFFNPGPGLGNWMLNATASFRIEAVVLAVGAIGVTGYVMNEIVSRLARAALRWRSTVEV